MAASLMTTHKATGEVVDLGLCSKMAGLRQATERVAKFGRPCWLIDADTAETWAYVTMSAGEVVATFEPRGQVFVMGFLRDRRHGLELRRIG